jgi:4'-phosphopantetheinyl transferase
VTTRQLDGLIRTVLDPVAEGLNAAAWALDFGMAGTPCVTVLENPTALPPRLPSVDELFLWFGVPTSDGWENLVPYLSEMEHEYITRLRQPADRWSFAAAHAGLRYMLGTVLSRLPREIEFVHGALGKPALDPGRHGDDARRVHFNISHTRGMVAVALAGGAVGVDVEALREMKDMRAVAETVFAAESLSALTNAASEAARTALFYRFWTLGEAFIKATGEGLAQGLKTFTFSASGAPCLTHVSGAWSPAARWRFGVFPD